MTTMHKKNTKDYLPLYLGHEIDTGTGTVTLTGVHIDSFIGIAKAVVLNGNVTHTLEISGVKPILRPLSDITNSEIEELLSVIMQDPNMSIEDAVTKEEISYERITPRTNSGLQFELTVAVRCFDGFLKIYKTGYVELTDEDHISQSIITYNEALIYLLKQGFDLFNLIQEGLACDKTKK